jgi:RNA polymerase sigma-70 factor (ECF subfamily)
MNDLLEVDDSDEFDAWLVQSNRNLARRTSQAIDIEGMLVTVRREAESRSQSMLRPTIVTGSGDDTPTVTGPDANEPTEASPDADEPKVGPEVDVRAAVAGDQRAIGRVIAYVRPLVVRYCRARVGRQNRSFGSADDVAQEVCLAVLTALPKYQDQGRPFLAFVYGIAAHKVADVHRAAARNRAEPVADVPDEIDDHVAGPEQRAIQGELNRRLKRLLEILPDKQREIVILRTIVGLSAEETAEAVGSTPGAVRVAQHRALHRLRRTLATEDVR